MTTQSHVSHLRSNIIIRTCFFCTLFIVAFRFGFEQSSYSVIECDEAVSVCVTGDRGDGSELYTLYLRSNDGTSQGIAYMVLMVMEHWISANTAHRICAKLLVLIVIVYIHWQIICCSSYLCKTLAPYCKHLCFKKGCGEHFTYF